MTNITKASPALDTPAMRELVTRLALEIDPAAKLEEFPEALAFQIDMARAVIRASLPTQPAAQATPEPLHLFEFWWEAHMPQATQAQAWAAWTDAQNSKGSAIDAAQPATPTQQAAVEPATIEDNSQRWQGMDGATAWHLIDRHADGWGDVAKMMGEWLKANTHPAPGVPDWAECLRISEAPDVDEALRLFAEGETREDQAVCIVRAVLTAAQAKGADHG